MVPPADLRHASGMCRITRTSRMNLFLREVVAIFGLSERGLGANLDFCAVVERPGVI
jgi:hypothetical protein